MSDPRPQFGRPEPGRPSMDRPAAFGLLISEGRLGTVRVTRPGEAPYLDLPGGAIEPGEDEAQAVVREVAEETGLIVRPLTCIARAGQYFLKSDGAAVNNIGGFWTLELIGQDPAVKIENDHELVWLDPEAALVSLRHQAHAWAVTAWLRWVEAGNETGG
ncbi:NUDIX domain-containing protein [Brevundimonas sp. VNH65]|uniref:NUDIX domain-containing protein n=1 Tax=Brevundimonas sp. VNH65 TaxID=3400917 RepID=UPI003C100726